uniref:Uncharacterized protein n=1 Tax=Arundo donax TaxID=35708 RepID=A0A0A9D6S6_ARUDO
MHFIFCITTGCFVLLSFTAKKQLIHFTPITSKEANTPRCTCSFRRLLEKIHFYIWYGKALEHLSVEILEMNHSNTLKTRKDAWEAMSTSKLHIFLGPNQSFRPQKHQMYSLFPCRSTGSHRPQPVPSWRLRWAIPRRAGPRRPAAGEDRSRIRIRSPRKRCRSWRRRREGRRRRRRWCSWHPCPPW